MRRGFCRSLFGCLQPLGSLLLHGLLGLRIQLALTHEFLGLCALAADHHEQTQIDIGLRIFRVELRSLHQRNARRIQVTCTQIGIAQVSQQARVHGVGHAGLLHLLGSLAVVTRLGRNAAQPIAGCPVLGASQQTLIDGYCCIELTYLAQRIGAQQARFTGSAPLLVQRIKVGDGGIPQRLGLHLAHQRQIGVLGIDHGVFFQRHLSSSLGCRRKRWLVLPH